MEEVERDTAAQQAMLRKIIGCVLDMLIWAMIIDLIGTITGVVHVGFGSAAASPLVEGVVPAVTHQFGATHASVFAPAFTTEVAPARDWGTTVFCLLMLVLGCVYWMLTLWRWGGTLGMCIVGVVAIDARSGARCSLRQAVSRQLCWVVDAFPYVVPALFGLVVAATNPHHQRLGDLLSGTVVVPRAFTRAG